MDKKKHRRICQSGIAETLPGHGQHNADSKGSSIAPSSIDLKKARRVASKKRTSLACNLCKSVKRKCGYARPCNRCISLGLSQSCDIDYNSMDFTCAVVDRPIEFSVSAMHFRNSTAFPQGNLKYHWTSNMIRPVWEIGYKYSEFADIYNAIPETMSAAIANLLSTFAQEVPSSRVNQTRNDRKTCLSSCSKYPHCGLLLQATTCTWAFAPSPNRRRDPQRARIHAAHRRSLGGRSGAWLPPGAPDSRFGRCPACFPLPAPSSSIRLRRPPRSDCAVLLDPTAPSSSIRRLQRVPIGCRAVSIPADRLRPRNDGAAAPGHQFQARGSPSVCAHACGRACGRVRMCVCARENGKEGGREGRNRRPSMPGGHVARSPLPSLPLPSPPTPPPLPPLPARPRALAWDLLSVPNV